MQIEQYFTKVIVGGLPVDVCDEAGLTALIVSKSLSDRATERKARLVFDVNGHGLALASIDAAYKKDLCLAEVVHADGQPIVWASKLLCAETILERTATTDLIHAIGRAAQSTGLKVFFLGAKHEVITRAARRFHELYPSAQLVGHRDGYFSDAELPKVAKIINASGADIVFVGLGKPREQAICRSLSKTLQVSWLITAGGCFDFLAGDAPRAPQLMQKMGLEWLYRLWADPRRLLWRYTWTNCVSLALILFKTKRKVVRA